MTRESRDSDSRAEGGRPPPPLSVAHVCDCQLSVPATAPAEALALYAMSAHLRSRLAAALGSHDLLIGRRGDAFLITPHDPQALKEALRVFGVTEGPELLAVPVVGGDLQVGGTAPAADWAERLATTWFAQASAQLHFHFQPIVALASGQLYGHEALVRARLGEELIGAPALLSAAAAHRQQRAFDAHARQEAIRQGYPQLEAGELLFINFAPGVVYNPDICLQTTFRACREVGADFSRLVFEVTESECFPDLELLQRILHRYRAEGAQVALDDLGAGHTSLTFLSLLRPDIVKLDRGLVRDLSESDPRFPLVLALVRYAHDLGIRVVAEGIETAGELLIMQQLGADYAQGYFLGRPAPQLGLSPQVRALWPEVSGAPLR